jgi:hypothetical protein
VAGQDRTGQSVTQGFDQLPRELSFDYAPLNLQRLDPSSFNETTFFSFTFLLARQYCHFPQQDRLQPPISQRRRIRYPWTKQDPSSFAFNIAPVTTYTRYLTTPSFLLLPILSHLQHCSSLWRPGSLIDILSPLVLACFQVIASMCVTSLCLRTSFVFHNGRSPYSGVHRQLDKKREWLASHEVSAKCAG